MTRWNVPDVRRAVKLAQDEGFEVVGMEFPAEGGFRLLTRRAPAAGNKPGEEGRQEDDAENEVAERRAKYEAQAAGRA